MNDARSILEIVFAVCAVAVAIALIWKLNRYLSRSGLDDVQKRGRYLINGVDKASKTEKTIAVIAENSANARAKGELEGLVVTSVKYIGN